MKRSALPPNSRLHPTSSLARRAIRRVSRQVVSPTVTRIVITGPIGAGKTTLASKLSCTLGIAHVELDALYWQPGWERTASVEFRTAVESAVSSGQWVAEGRCEMVLESGILDHASELVLLDVPLPVIVPWVVGRQIGCVLLRTKLWNGNRARLSQLWRDESLIQSAIRSSDRHKVFLRDVDDNPRLSLRLTHLRSRREGRSWLGDVADAHHAGGHRS